MTQRIQSLSIKIIAPFEKGNTNNQQVNEGWKGPQNFKRERIHAQNSIRFILRLKLKWPNY